jgi:hypothetical protein
MRWLLHRRQRTGATPTHDRPQAPCSETSSKMTGRHRPNGDTSDVTTGAKNCGSRDVAAPQSVEVGGHLEHPTTPRRPARGAFRGRREAQRRGQRAQRASSTDSPPLSERSERSERSEFGGAAPARASQRSRPARADCPTGPKGGPVRRRGDRRSACRLSARGARRATPQGAQSHAGAPAGGVRVASNEAQSSCASPVRPRTPHLTPAPPTPSVPRSPPA